MGGLKEAINQPHINLKAKNEAILNIEQLIQEGEYQGGVQDIKGRPFTFHYIKTKIGGRDSFIVLREEKGSLNFYSIVEKRRDASREDSPGYTVQASSEKHLLHDKNSKKSLLARAKARHEARSAVEIDRIKKRWEVRGNIHRYSDQLERLQQEYKDVAPSLSALAEKTLIEMHMGWIRGEELTKRLAALTRKVEIKKLWDEGREVRNLATLLHNPAHSTLKCNTRGKKNSQRSSGSLAV